MFTIVLWKLGTTTVQKTSRPNSSSIYFIHKKLFRCENQTRNLCVSTGAQITALIMSSPKLTNLTF